MTPDARVKATPADGLLGAIPVVALALLIVNDHVLKAAWPGPVTGKLSDVAGLIVAPLALQAAVEVGLWVSGRWVGPSLRVLAAGIVAVGLGFAAVKLWAPATDLYRWGLGAAQWPFLAASALLSGAPPPGIAPVRVTADASDLLALPALAITWRSGRRRVAQAG